MDIPIIQSLWVGNTLSLVEQLSIASFIRNGHEFHLYTYNDLSNVPEGAQLKDANEILPEKEIFTYNNGSYAGFADWFRWAMLYKKGNFWVDLDVICLKPFQFNEDLIYGFQDIDLVCNAVLGFPANHDISKFMENICDNPNLFLPYDSSKTKRKKLKRRFFNNSRSNTDWCETGPIGFTQALKHFNLLTAAKPFTYFYPINFSNWNAIFDETLSDDISLFSNTYSIHLWNEMIRKKIGFDKNSTFHKNSMFEQLKNKYL